MRTIFAFLMIRGSLSAAPIYRQIDTDVHSPFNRDFMAYAQSVTVTETTEIEQIWIRLNRDDVMDGEYSMSVTPTFVHWTRYDDNDQIHFKREASWTPTLMTPGGPYIPFNKPMQKRDVRWLGARPVLESEVPYVIEPGEHFFGVIASGEMDNFVGHVTGNDSLIVALEYGPLLMQSDSSWHEVSKTDPDTIKALAVMINDTPWVPEPSTAVLALLALPCLWRTQSTTNGIGEPLNC